MIDGPDPADDDEFGWTEIACAAAMILLPIAVYLAGKWIANG